jgi:hypothetical protein
VSAKSRHRTVTRSAKSGSQASLNRHDRRGSSSATLLSLTYSGLNALRARLERRAEHPPGAKVKADSEPRKLLDALERLRADYERVLRAD